MQEVYFNDFTDSLKGYESLGPIKNIFSIWNNEFKNSLFQI
jgi:hypothetical protein